jgi:hypothetical protein
MTIALDAHSILHSYQTELLVDGLFRGQSILRVAPGFIDCIGFQVTGRKL